MKTFKEFINEGKTYSLSQVENIFKKVEKEMKKIKSDEDYGEFLDSIEVDDGADLFDNYWSSADKVHYQQAEEPGLIDLLKYFDKKL
jgi:hypothetical protein